MRRPLLAHWLVCPTPTGFAIVISSHGRYVLMLATMSHSSTQVPTSRRPRTHRGFLLSAVEDKEEPGERWEGAVPSPLTKLRKGKNLSTRLIQKLLKLVVARLVDTLFHYQ